MNDNDKPHWGELEKRFHEPARLAVVSALCESQQGLGFTELKALCGLTDGNLSRHLKVLEEGDIIRVHKAGKGRASHTLVTLSDEGREAFLDYLQALERVLHRAMGALEPASGLREAWRGFRTKTAL